jgi:hypothetical protein
VQCLARAEAPNSSRISGGDYFNLHLLPCFKDALAKNSYTIDNLRSKLMDTFRNDWTSTARSDAWDYGYNDRLTVLAETWEDLTSPPNKQAHVSDLLTNSLCDKLTPGSSFQHYYFFSCRGGRHAVARWEQDDSSWHCTLVRYAKTDEFGIVAFAINPHMGSACRAGGCGALGHVYHNLKERGEIPDEDDFGDQGF